MRIVAAILTRQFDSQLPQFDSYANFSCNKFAFIPQNVLNYGVYLSAVRFGSVYLPLRFICGHFYSNRLASCLTPPFPTLPTLCILINFWWILHFAWWPFAGHLAANLWVERERKVQLQFDDWWMISNAGESSECIMTKRLISEAFKWTINCDICCILDWGDPSFEM